MPSIFEQTYRFTPETRLDPTELNNRFWSVDARLRALERQNASLDQLIETLRGDGVSRLTTALQTLLPSILADAQSGYLSGLGDASILWSAIDTTGATPASIGAEVAGTMALHLATPGVHSISDVADLGSALAGKQPYSALLTAIAAAAPTELGVPVGTGTTYQVLALEAGDSIAISQVGDRLRIDATGSASGESNSGANLGAGLPIYAGKVGTTLNFKTLIAADNSIDLVQAGDSLSLRVNAAALEIGIDQVINLTEGLSEKQPLSSNLSTLAELVPVAGQVVTGAGGSFQLATLTAGDNITITPNGSTITIAAINTGEANTASNLGSTGAGIFAGKSDVDLRFRRLSSLADFVVLSEASNTVNLDFDTSAFLSGLPSAAISWGKVSKAGAMAADVGAEPTGAVATHAGGAGVHGISGVQGLQTALDARVELVKGSTQSMQTSLAITPATANVGSYTPNLAGQNYFVLTQTSNTTINNPTNLPSGKVMFLDLILIQDSTGGRTTTWGNAYTWGDGGAPTLKTTPNAVNLLTFKHWNGKLYFLGHRSY
ncbi:MAG: hypothetical protein ACHWZW_03080 [Spirulina sp.]